MANPTFNKTSSTSQIPHPVNPCNISIQTSIINNIGNCFKILLYLSLRIIKRKDKGNKHNILSTIFLKNKGKYIVLKYLLIEWKGIKFPDNN